MVQMNIVLIIFLFVKKRLMSEIIKRKSENRPFSNEEMYEMAY
jgi:hypothetical protein